MNKYEVLTRDEFLGYIAYKRRKQQKEKITIKNILLNSLFLENLHAISFTDCTFQNCILNGIIRLDNCSLSKSELLTGLDPHFSKTRFNNCVLKCVGETIFTKNTFGNCSIEKVRNLNLNLCRFVNTDFIDCLFYNFEVKRTTFTNSFFRSCEFPIKLKIKQKIFIGCDFPSRPSSSRPFRKEDIQK